MARQADVLPLDLDAGPDTRPAARQMRASLLEYMKSGKFNPAYE